MNGPRVQTPLVQDPPPKRSGVSIAVRIAITAAAIALWFLTQALIGSRSLVSGGIGDGLHVLTAPVNLYLHAHPRATNVLLIVSSGVIDLLAIYLLAKWVFGASLRPFRSLLVLLGLRQIMQALVALPVPPNAIWHYPGFPSLLVTYGVANDYFFSGHTAMAVLAATELAREGRRWLTALAVVLVLFEMTTVLVLRAHYTMDVFTGAVTALLVSRWSASLDQRPQAGK